MATATVEITPKAVKAPVVITLTSSDKISSVPAKVEIAVGAATATFQVTTTAVETDTSSVITATTAKASVTANLSILTPKVIKMTLAPTSVMGGTASTATIELNAKAGATPVTVALKCSNAISTVPATVQVAAGANTATFPVTTLVTANDTSSQVTATVGKSSITSSINVLTPKITKITLAPNSVPGGTSPTATVELAAKAGSLPVEVKLKSSNANFTVPPTMTVASGTNTGTFPVTTVAVATDATTQITATVGKTTATATLNVSSPKPVDFAFSPASVQGGSLSTGTVKLNAPAPVGGFKVEFAANSPFWGGPKTLIIPGGATSAMLPVTTVPVVGATDVSISVSGGGHRIVTSLKVTPPVFTTFQLDASTVTGGSVVKGTFSINAPAPKEGFRVKVSSDNELAKTPGYVTIPAGGTTAKFEIQTKRVTSSKIVRITAGGSGAWVELSISIEPAKGG